MAVQPAAVPAEVLSPVADVVEPAVVPLTTSPYYCSDVPVQWRAGPAVRLTVARATADFVPGAGPP